MADHRQCAEFIAGAEEEWRKRTGRALTARTFSECSGVIQAIPRPE